MKKLIALLFAVTLFVACTPTKKADKPLAGTVQADGSILEPVKTDTVTVDSVIVE